MAKIPLQGKQGPVWHIEAGWRICGLFGTKPLSEPMLEPLGTNFNDIFIEIQTFSLKEMHLNMLSAKWQPFCLSLNVVTHRGNTMEADVIMSQGSRVSTTMVLIKFCQEIVFENGVQLAMWSARSWPFCSGLNVLNHSQQCQSHSGLRKELSHTLKKYFILIQIWLKFIPKDSVNNKPVLVQIKVWRRIFNNPLSESMRA